MKKHLKFGLLLLVVMLAVSLVASGCGGGQKPAEQKPAEQKAAEVKKDEFKVGFIYVGPVGDEGWTYAHDQGRKFLEKEVPGVKTTILESIKENAESEVALTKLVQEGNKVIFATSFGYMDFVQKVAQKYPDVTFLHCSGFKTAANVGTYFGRIYQPRYLSGIAAGKQTKSNTVGYVAAFPIPEVVRGINAFTLGVRSVNPNATVKVVWTNTWYDPAKEKDAAKSLLDGGADVIAMHQDTPGPMQAAEEKGVYGISYNSDMRARAPKAVLTGPVWNWGPYYVNTVKAVQNKTWKSDQYWGPMSDKIVDLSDYGPMVSDETKAEIAKKKDMIIKGQWDVFTGPIKDQKGEVKVPEGKKMTDDEMLKFDWFVQGVEGTIPK